MKITIETTESKIRRIATKEESHDDLTYDDVAEMCTDVLRAMGYYGIRLEHINDNELR
jgi:hypothetical protein